MSKRGRTRWRQTRLSAYRTFGQQHGWEVLGLCDDLAQLYESPALLGTSTAQAELALGGRHDQFAAVVASVLVRSRRSTWPHRDVDLVVQLTVLETGKATPTFRSTVGAAATTSIAPLRISAAEAERVELVLHAAAARGAVRRDDFVAARDGTLHHTRNLSRSGDDVDVCGPLTVLADLATQLAAARPLRRAL